MRLAEKVPVKIEHKFESGMSVTIWLGEGFVLAKEYQGARPTWLVRMNYKGVRGGLIGVTDPALDPIPVVPFKPALLLVDSDGFVVQD